ncbi:hypothetical protein ACFLWS_03685 [Chloroflexota bacterium]
MDVSRRRFLKLGGVALLGSVTRPVFDILTRLELAQASRAGGNSAEKSWAMVIDMNACRAQEKRDRVSQ